MTMKSKVIEGLKHCAVEDDCRGCPYRETCWSTGNGDFGHMVNRLLKDALEVLEGRHTDDI